jgi:hypothetical protein
MGLHAVWIEVLGNELMGRDVAGSDEMGLCVERGGVRLDVKKVMGSWDLRWLELWVSM